MGGFGEKNFPKRSREWDILEEKTPKPGRRPATQKNFARQSPALIDQWPLHRKTFLSEAESGTHWRRKPLSPAEGRLRKKTLKSKTSSYIMHDFYTEKIRGLYDISFVDVMSHQKVT